MKLRTKFVLFVVILHLVALALSYFVFSGNKLLFIVSEVFILVSVIMSWQLYNQLIQPLKLLMQGKDAIRDRDFSVKFVATGKYEIDELIDVYNQMIDALRAERSKQEQQHYFLEKLVRTSPTGILILDYDEHIQQVNPKALQFLDMTENQVLGKPLAGLEHLLYALTFDDDTAEVLKNAGADLGKVREAADTWIAGTARRTDPYP